MESYSSFTQLPSLPSPTDIDLAVEDGVLLIRMQINERQQTSRKLILLGFPMVLAGMFLGNVLVALFDFVTWIAIGGMVILVLFLAIGATFMILSRVIDTITATVTIRDNEIVIEESMLQTELSQVFERARIHAVKQGFSEKKQLIHSLDGRLPGQIPIFKFASKPELQLWTDDEKVVGVLASWRENDLIWLASALSTVWGLEQWSDVLPVASRETCDVGTKYDNEVAKGYRHPGVITFFFSISLFMFGIGSYRLPSAISSSNWPKAPGKATHAFYEIKDGKYTAEMKYHYIVNDVEYEGDNVSFSRPNSDKVLHDFITAYDVGSNLEVHYDPKDPSRSVLIPGASNFMWFTISFGFGSLLLALYLFLTR